MTGINLWQEEQFARGKPESDDQAIHFHQVKPIGMKIEKKDSDNTVYNDIMISR